MPLQRAVTNPAIDAAAGVSFSRRGWAGLIGRARYRSTDRSVCATSLEMISLGDILDTRDVILGLRAHDVTDAASHVLAQTLPRHGFVANEVHRLIDAVTAREREAPTTCGMSAIPHARDAASANSSPRSPSIATASSRGVPSRASSSPFSHRSRNGTSISHCWRRSRVSLATPRRLIRSRARARRTRSSRY